MIRQPFIGKFALGLAICFLIGVVLAPYFRGEKILNPVAFAVSGWEIHWYGILMALAVVVCVGLALWFNRIGSDLPGDKQVSVDTIISSATWAAAGGLLGARFLYILLKLSDYTANPLEAVMIQNGGLSIHGAILGGVLGLGFWCLITKTPIKPLADLFALVLPVGQAIGRWGNFFNQEAFGGPTNLPWKMFIEPAHRPLGLENFTYFHPTFLYESLGCLLIFWLLWRIFNRVPRMNGQIVIIYLVLYSALRFIIEFWRVDSDQLGFFSWAQWASLAIVVVAGIIWWFKYRRKNE
jgi:phosphatidylglycerol---prolipoprotein diacylglyceryl transferase